MTAIFPCADCCVEPDVGNRIVVSAYGHKRFGNEIGGEGDLMLDIFHICDVAHVHAC